MRCISLKCYVACVGIVYLNCKTLEELDRPTEKASCYFSAKSCRNEKVFGSNLKEASKVVKVCQHGISGLEIRSNYQPTLYRDAPKLIGFFVWQSF